MQGARNKQTKKQAQTPVNGFERDKPLAVRSAPPPVLRRLPVLPVTFVCGAVVLSFLLHTAFFSGVGSYQNQAKKAQAPVTMRVAVKEKLKELPPPPPPPAKPKKPKPKETKPPDKKVTAVVPPQANVAQTPPPAPVQGLPPAAVSPNGTGIAVPIGNTLMAEDTGQRLRPEDVKPLTQEDLSSAARLIRSSVVTPTYTDDAVDAGIEGTFVVDVYVDASGAVTSAELAKKLGYGMDERLIAAAIKARFQPRQDNRGKPEAGWATISFRLEMP